MKKSETKGKSEGKATGQKFEAHGIGQQGESKVQQFVGKGKSATRSGKKKAA